MAANRYRKTLMTIAMVMVLACSAAAGDDPDYYVKKSTWQETMHAARQELMSFHVREKAEKSKRISELGIELGAWYQIGPFISQGKEPYGIVFGPEKDYDLNKSYGDVELKWKARPDWQDAAIHNLSGHPNNDEGKVAADYLFRNIKSDKAATLVVYLGSNDGIRLWLNGEQLLAKDIGRSCAPDQDIVKLNLKQGDNKLLIKVNNRAASHQFYFSIHPSDVIMTRRAEELWTFLRRDFPDMKSLRQMRWELQDNIWPKAGAAIDLASLGANYAKATRTIGNLPERTAELASEIKSISQLRKLRRLYYRSRRFDEQMTLLKRKLDMVTDQLGYLEKRLGDKKEGLDW
jgi:hypothetical protein